MRAVSSSCCCCKEASARANSRQCQFCYRNCEAGACHREPLEPEFSRPVCNCAAKEDSYEAEHQTDCPLRAAAPEPVPYYDRERAVEDYEDELARRDRRGE